MRIVPWLRDLEWQLSSRRSSKSRRLRPARLAGFDTAAEVLTDRLLLTTFTVNTLADTLVTNPAVTSLRDAITAADNQAGNAIINFSVAGTIDLVGVLPDLSGNIQILGPGAGNLAVRRDTGGDYRIFKIAGGSTVVLDGLTISNGSETGIANYGGGIYNDGGTLTVTNSILSDNTAGNTTYYDNSASYGGGIYNNAGTLTVNNSILNGNTAYAYNNYSPLNNGAGGGIYNNRGTLVVDDSTLSSNFAYLYGGGIANWDGTLIVDGSTLSGNNTVFLNSCRGGGVENDGGGTAIVSNCSLSDNSSGTGGGIDNANGTITVSNSHLLCNSAGSGGGINNANGTSMVVNSTLSGNSANEGGGIFNYNFMSISYVGTVSVSNSTLSGNSANKGGGIDNDGARLTVSNSTLSSNYTDGLYGGFGGGIFNDTTLAYLHASIASVTVTDATLSGNFAGEGGGIYNGNGWLTVYNSIVANSVGGDVTGFTGDFTGSSNLFGSVGLGPLQDNGGPTWTMALPDGSPAIDAGNNSLVPADVTDDQRGAGIPRVFYGTVDIGAFESESLTQAATTVALTSSANPEQFAQQVTFTATVSAAAGTPVGTVQFFDGATLLDTEGLVAGSAQITTSSLSVQDHTISAVYGGSRFLAAAESSLTQTISKADQSISFAPIADKAYGAGAILSAWATSGLPLSFSVLSGPATVSDSTLTLTGTGTVVVEASQAGDDDYNSATPVDQTFNVIAASPASRLDPTFGVGGKVTASTGIPQQMTITPDGKFLVVSKFFPDYEVSRFNADGSLDTSFGNGGTQTLAFNRVAEIVVGQDNSIVVAGSIDQYSQTLQAVNFDFAVARVTPAGQLDAAFGSGGIQTIDFSEYYYGYLSSLDGFAVTDDFATSVSVSSDGSVEVQGTITDYNYGDSWIANVATRLTPAGQLDSSFGDGNGKMIINGSVPSPAPANVAQQADGKTITVGSQDGEFAVTRSNADGTADATFGAGGTQGIDFDGNSLALVVAVQADGKIVAAGYDYSTGFVMARLTGKDGVTVLGTANVDTISIDPGTQPGTMKTTVNGVVTDNITVDGEVFVMGLGGNDAISATWAPPGGLVLDGGDGSDTYDVWFGNLAGTVVVTDSGTSGTDQFTAHGTAGNDYIFKNDSKVTLGSPVQETILYSEIESLIIHGGAGDDTIVDPGTNSTYTQIYGDAGNDTIIINATGAAGVFLDGGAGSDTYIINAGSLAGPVTIADSGTSGTDSVKIAGTSNDTLGQSATGLVLDGTAINISGVESTAAQGLTDLVPDDVRVLLLDPSGIGALTDSGNGSVVVGGAGVITVASTSSTALADSGNGNVTASELDMVSATGTQVTGNGKLKATLVEQVSTDEAADPLASLPAPAIPTTTFAAVNYSGNAARTLQPGTYAGGIHISGSGTVTLAAGVYYLQGGGFSVFGSGSVIGNGVVLYNAPTAAGDAVSLTGKGSVILSAPASGCYQGVVFFQARTARNSITVSGSGGLNLTGTLYAPAATVVLAGNGPLAFQGAAGRLIAADLRLTGNGSLTANTASTSSGGTQKLSTADGSGDASNSTPLAGNLAVGMLTVAVDDLAGDAAADEEQRIEDAIATIESELAPEGISLVEVFGDAAAAANIHIHMAATSSIGGVAQGVLGVTVNGSDITLISGWSWFTGADPATIAAGQYDFQTVVTHELGHATGLGHSTDNGSVMYPTLAAGDMRHDLTAADLAVLESGDDGQPEPLLAAAPAASESGEVLTPATATLATIGNEASTQVQLGESPVTIGRTAAIVPVASNAVRASSIGYVFGAVDDLGVLTTAAAALSDTKFVSTADRTAPGSAALPIVFENDSAAPALLDSSDEPILWPAPTNSEPPRQLFAPLDLRHL
jgi:uncharacterized delta-60 repeat protein